MTNNRKTMTFAIAFIVWVIFEYVMFLGAAHHSALGSDLGVVLYSIFMGTGLAILIRLLFYVRSL